MLKTAESDEWQALKDHVQETLLLIVGGAGLLSLCCVLKVRSAA